jgi:pimeloyl-ACP methyl ester carboxylesterase
VREFPVFVPYGDEHVAAVVTVPDGQPRGLVVLATGLGAPRSHRHQVWAVAAERLARSSIASVRFDYLALHDSTGSAQELRSPPTGEAMAVAQFARRAIGAGEVIAVGNCWGAHVALNVAARMEACVGAVCILPETVEPGRAGSALRRAPGRKMARLLQSNRKIRRILKPLKRRDVQPSQAVRDLLPRALERSKVLFVYDEEHLDSGRREFGMVRALLDRLPEDVRGRFELHLIPGRGLARLRSVEVQESLLTTILEWAEERFLPEREAQEVADASLSSEASVSLRGVR